MKKAILLALFLVGCVFATDLSNVNPATIILGTDSPTIIDDKIRYLAEAVNTSYDVEHHLTGEHQIPYGLQADRPASPKDGQLFFNLSSGQLEMYMSQTKSYTGTADINADSSASQLTVVASGAKFLSSVHTGASVDFYLDLDGSGEAIQLDSVNSDTQLTLKSAYDGTKSDCSTSGNCNDKAFTVRLNASAQWVAVDKLLQESFELEHHIRTTDSAAQKGAGEHKIQIRTDDADPANVKDNQWWFDTSGGKNRVKFRDAGTTKAVTAGQTMVWITPSVKVAGAVKGSSDGGYTAISCAADTGTATAVFVILQTEITNTTCCDKAGLYDAEVRFRDTGSVVDSSDMIKTRIQRQATGTAITIGETAMVIVPVDAAESFDYKWVRTSFPGGAAASNSTVRITMVGYIK